MAEEQSIKNQIAAMEGWAIKAKQSADAGKYEEAEGLLRNINTQGRRLEWRGGSRGIKHLPDMEEVKVLKKKISEARAAAQTAQSSIQHMEKVIGKEKKGSSKEEHFAIENKKVSYQKEITKSLAILIEVTKRANAVVKDEPWINPTYLTRKDNSEVLLQFVQTEKYYKHLNREEITNLRNKFLPLFRNGFFKSANLKGANFINVNLTGANFSGADLDGAHFIDSNLSGANLSKAILTWANLKDTNLSGADLSGAILKKAFLDRANLSGADLSGANLTGAELREANLTGANFSEADLDGAGLENANLGDVRKLTKEQLHAARNWDEANNIPSYLK